MNGHRTKEIRFLARKGVLRGQPLDDTVYPRVKDLRRRVERALRRKYQEIPRALRGAAMRSWMSRVRSGEAVVGE